MFALDANRFQSSISTRRIRVNGCEFTYCACWEKKKEEKKVIRYNVTSSVSAVDNIIIISRSRLYRRALLDLRRIRRYFNMPSAIWFRFSSCPFRLLPGRTIGSRSIFTSNNPPRKNPPTSRTFKENASVFIFFSVPPIERVSDLVTVRCLDSTLSSYTKNVRKNSDSRSTLTLIIIITIIIITRTRDGLTHFRYDKRRNTQTNVHYYLLYYTRISVAVFWYFFFFFTFRSQYIR